MDTIKRSELQTVLKILGITKKLPAFGRALLVAFPSGTVWKITKAYGNTGKAKPTDTFVVQDYLTGGV